MATYKVKGTVGERASSDVSVAKIMYIKTIKAMFFNGLLYMLYVDTAAWHAELQA